MALELSEPQLNVTLVTRNLAAASRFYGELMRFEALAPRALPGGGAQGFRVGDHVIELRDLGDGPVQDEGGTDRANGMRLLAFILDDLAGLLARFDGAGHRYRTLPLPANSTFEVAFASDADGNALELVGLKRAAGERLKTRMQIGLTVSDIAAAKRFYGEVLGLPAEPEMKLPANMGMVGDVRYGYVAGATTIKFWSKVSGPLPKHTGAPERRTGIRLIQARVRDLSATREQLIRHAVPVEAGPPGADGTPASLFAADPDGNLIELSSSPHAG